MVKINGEEWNLADKTVAEYLAENGYDIKRVAVELNGDILPKSQYESALLQEGDCVEIVSFVGGG
ncbi:MAG: sulfur carrier protein ThiS [Ruminococcus sp.]|nr:sulfur carrier protein ThiS [Ruminococcus sp.]